METQETKFPSLLASTFKSVSDKLSFRIGLKKYDKIFHQAMKVPLSFKFESNLTHRYIDNQRPRIK